MMLIKKKAVYLSFNVPTGHIKCSQEPQLTITNFTELNVMCTGVV